MLDDADKLVVNEEQVLDVDVLPVWVVNTVGNTATPRKSANHPAALHVILWGVHPPLSSYCCRQSLVRGVENWHVFLVHHVLTFPQINLHEVLSPPFRFYLQLPGE